MSIAVIGEALIDFIAGEDGAYRAHPGGSPFNVAIGLARQGIDVSYLSPLSDDRFGDRLHQALRAEGVTLPLTRRSRLPTSLALVTVEEHGLPSYRLYRQGVADKDVGYAELAACLPGDLRLLHTGSLALTPSQLPRIRQVFALMRERGIPISVDVNIRLRASADADAYLAGVRSLFPLCDILKASDEDLDALALHADRDQAVGIVRRELGHGVFVLTAGQGGARVYTPQGVHEVTTYPVAALVDTVGAGDTFHAGFLSFLHRSGALAGAVSGIAPTTLTAAADYACAAAAINVSRAGCAPPTREETQALVATRSG